MSDESPSTSDPSMAALSAPSAAQRLPNEIIHKIFLLHFHSPSRSSACPFSAIVGTLRKFLSATFPYNVSHVARAWRAVALSEPEWWTTPAIAFYDLGVLKQISSARLESPYEMVARWLEMCLAKADGVKGQAINGVVKFGGDYVPQLVIKALAPLHRRMDKWRELEISLHEQRYVYTAISSLSELRPLSVDLACLKNIRALTLGGSIWRIPVDYSPFDLHYFTGLVQPPSLPQLESLTTLRLANLAPTACIQLIGAAKSSLEELYLTTDQYTKDWMPLERIFAPRLRIFELVFSGKLPSEYFDPVDFAVDGLEEYFDILDGFVHPLFRYLRCDALEDLTVVFVDDEKPPLREIRHFVSAGGFAQSLRSFKLECLAKSLTYDYRCLLDIFEKTTELRSLALLCSPPQRVLEYLSRFGIHASFYSMLAAAVLDGIVGADEIVIAPRVFSPLLKEVHIRGARAPAAAYVQMLAGPGDDGVFGAQSLSKAIFEDCFVMQERSLFKRERRAAEKYKMLSSVDALGIPGEKAKFLCDAGALDLTFKFSSA